MKRLREPCLIRIRDVIVPGNHGFGTEGALGTRDSAARAPAELVLLSEPCTSLVRTSHDCELVGSPVASAVRLKRELWERGTRSQQSHACRLSCRSDDAARLVTSPLRHEFARDVCGTRTAPAPICVVVLQS